MLFASGVAVDATMPAYWSISSGCCIWFCRSFKRKRPLGILEL